MNTHRCWIADRFEDVPADYEYKVLNNEYSIKIEKSLTIFEQLHNVNQLFDIFTYNIALMLDKLTLYASDHVSNNITRENATLTEVNSHFINIISSGRNFMELLEVYLKNDLKEYNGELHFKDIVSTYYDQEYTYRFFYELRNFVQHGHVPISQKPDGRFYFDIEQISSEIHFDPQKNFLSLLELISTSIPKLTNNEPDLALTIPLISYVSGVTNMYYRILLKIKPTMHQCHIEMQNFISECHECIIDDIESLKGYIVYKCEDGNMHCFSTNENAWNAYIELINKIKPIAKKYQKLYDEFSSCTINVGNICDI